MIILGDIHINHLYKVNGTAKRKRKKKTTYFREEIALVIDTGIHAHVITKMRKTELVLRVENDTYS